MSASATAARPSRDSVSTSPCSLPPCLWPQWASFFCGRVWAPHLRERCRPEDGLRLIPGAPHPALHLLCTRPRPPTPLPARGRPEGRSPRRTFRRPSCPGLSVAAPQHPLLPSCLLSMAQRNTSDPRSPHSQRPELRAPAVTSSFRSPTLGILPTPRGLGARPSPSSAPPAPLPAHRVGRRPPLHTTVPRQVPAPFLSLFSETFVPVSHHEENTSFRTSFFFY